MIGVDTAKDTLYARLRFEEIGPGYVHFPIGGRFDASYFAQLTSEEVATRYSEGRPIASGRCRRASGMKPSTRSSMFWPRGRRCPIA
jgi:phage terminase large subunit GpA-like protein